MRKRHAIIHIGTGKTGSTSIQEMLASSRETLPPIGFAYLLSPGRRTQVMLAVAAVNNRGADKIKRMSGTEGDQGDVVERFRAALAAEMALLPDQVHTVIFSSEHLTNKVATINAAARLKALLDEHFESYRIVVYLRRQDEYLGSLYSTRLRAGSRRSEVLPHGTPKQLGRLDWKAMLDRWATVFGRGTITPRLFARDAFVKGDLIEDFRTVCGLEALALPKPPELLNQSLNIAAQEFMRRLNMASGGSDTEAEADEAEDHEDGVGDRLPHSIRMVLGRQFPGPGRRPSRAEAESLMAHFEDSNEALRVEYFPARARLFSADFTKYPETADPLPDAEAVLQVSLAVVLALRDAAGGVKAEGGAKAAAGGLRAAGNVRDGRRALEQALEADPGNAEALRKLVQAAADPAGREIARAWVQRALAAEPDRRDLVRLDRRLQDAAPAADAAAAVASTAAPPLSPNAATPLSPEERAARRERRAARQKTVAA